VEACGERVNLRPVDAPAQVGEVLEGLLSGEVGVERQIGREEAKVSADLDGVLAGVEAQHAAGSRGGTDEVKDRPDRRRFPCAVWPEESDDLAGLDGERDVVNGGERAEDLGEAVYLDGGGRGHDPSFLMNSSKRSMTRGHSASKNRTIW